MVLPSVGWPHPLHFGPEQNKRWNKNSFSLLDCVQAGTSIFSCYRLGWNYTHRLSWVSSVPTAVSLHNRVSKFLRINLCLHVHLIGSVCLENPAEYHVETDRMQKQTGRSSLCIVIRNRSAKSIYTAMPLLSLYVTRSRTK